jgi:hypothetical protein
MKAIERGFSNGARTSQPRLGAEGMERYPVELLTYCVLPNHCHVVVRPGTNEAGGA